MGCKSGLNHIFSVSDSKRSEGELVAGGSLNYLEDELDEARTSIEVCENSGLFFTGKREVVLEKLMELVRNVARSKEERIGISFLRGSMESFSDFIVELSLIDLPLQGGCFMWSNFKDNPSFSRLDRFLISPDVLSMWPDLIQSLHAKSISDHNRLAYRFLKGRSNHIGSFMDGTNALKRPEEIKKSIEMHFKNIYNELNTLKVERLDYGLNKLSEAEASSHEKPFMDCPCFGRIIESSWT
ncbi:hypothetical protein V6N13_110103 [Hibiscus sabdariffa]